MCHYLKYPNSDFIKQIYVKGGERESKIMHHIVKYFPLLLAHNGHFFHSEKSIVSKNSLRPDFHNSEFIQK